MSLSSNRFKTLAVWGWVGTGMSLLLSYGAILLNLHSQLFPPFPVELKQYQSPANPNTIILEATNKTDQPISGINLEMLCSQRVEAIKVSQHNKIMHANKDSNAINIPSSLNPGRSISVEFVIEQTPFLFDVRFTSDNTKSCTLNEQENKRKLEENIRSRLITSFVLFVVLSLGFVALEMHLEKKKLEKRLHSVTKFTHK